MGEKPREGMALDPGTADPEDPLGGGIEIEHGSSRVDKDDPQQGGLREGDETLLDAFCLGAKGLLETQVLEENQGLDLLSWRNLGEGKPYGMGMRGMVASFWGNFECPSKHSRPPDFLESILQFFGGKNGRKRTAQDLGARQAKLPKKRGIG